MQVISGAVLAAFIGGGGLGDFITAGIAMMAWPQILVGAIPVTLLALGADFLFGRLQRRLTPAGAARGMIALEGLTKRFPGATAPAVDALSLEVGAGEICVLIGPSGCGKTTTMRMINRMIEPDAGRISHRRPRRHRASIPSCCAARIGYVIQQVGLFPHLTIARRTSRRCRVLLGWDRARASHERVDELLALVDMAPSAIAIAIRASCRAGRSSASVWRARSPPIRR